MKRLPGKETDGSGVVIFERLMLFISAACTFLIFGWVCWFLRFGFEFQDEGFYLVWISNPFKYTISVSQFGFIYHPLYLLLDGSIVLLRQVNVAVTFFLAWILFNLFIKKTYNNQVLTNTHRYIVSGAFSTASLLFLYIWLPTPSYNWLAFQSLLLCATGFLLAEKNNTKSSVIGWLLIGVSGWLAFMAKPSTAVALGLCTLLYLLAAKKMSMRLLATSLAATFFLLVLSAFVMDGSVAGFIYRIKDGADFAALLGAGHTLSSIFRVDSFQPGLKASLIFLAGTVCLTVVACFSQIKVGMHAGRAAQIGVFLAVLLIVSGLTHKTLDAGRYQHLLLMIVPFSALLTGLCLYKIKGLLKITCPQWALAIAFVIFPHIFSFGTNNNYWWLGGLAGIFWVLAGLVFLAPIIVKSKFIELLLPFGFAVQLLTAVLLLTSMEHPYYQPEALRKNDYRTEIGQSGSTLVLPGSFGLYITEAADLAKKAGFKIGTPMIDLSGHSPGLLYAIGADNTGAPWILGTFPGYVGSNKAAEAMLKRTSCEELSNAWLLVEPEGPVKVSPDVLAAFGADLTTDFERVASFKTAQGASGFQEIQVQQFLKPVRSHDVAMKACAMARNPAL